jgi:hypothetical protein
MLDNLLVFKRQQTVLHTLAFLCSLHFSFGHPEPLTKIDVQCHFLLDMVDNFGRLQ